MSYPNLNLLLHAANRRELFLGLARVGLLGLGVWLVGLLLALATDAIFALPVAALVVVDAGLLIVVLWTLGKLWQVVRRGRFDPRRLARLLEQQMGLANNALINAIDLREPSDGAASRRLASLAVDQGEAAARQVEVRRAISGAAARRAARWASLVLGVALLVDLLLPGVFARGLPRLVDPTGNHPPFTLVKFDVQTQPDPLYYGSSAVVTARLSGPVATDQADLVFDDGNTRQRLPMIETDEGYQLDLQRAEHTRWFYIDTPKGRSDRYELTVRQVPLIEELWVTYHYPAHTNWPSRRYRLSSHKIEALSGTNVTLEASSNFPLSTARVELFGEGTAGPVHQLQLTPAVEHGRLVRGGFRLTQSGRLTLRLVGANQQLGPELREVPLIAIDDQAPHVTIVDPEPLTLAVEGWKLPLNIDASDDVRVSGLRANYQLEGQSLQTLPLTTHSTDPRQMQGQAELDLAQLAVKAGERIRLFASATDNYPEGGQMSDSDSHMIQVISREEYFDYLRSDYQMQQLSEEIAALNERLGELTEQRQRMLEEADALQRSLADGQPLDQQQTQQQQSLEQKLERYSRELTELAGQLDERLEVPRLYDAEHAYRQQLAQLAEQLKARQQHVEALRQAIQELTELGAPGAGDRERIEQLLEQLRQHSETPDDPTTTGLADSQQQAEKLTQAQRMLTELQRIQRVVGQQRELANRMQTPHDQRAASTTDPRRADQLARQQERLNQELQEAQSELRQAAEEANETLPRTSADACQLCDSIDRNGISGDQQQAARAARQGAIPRAGQFAQRAAEKLKSLGDRAPSSTGVGREWNPDDLDRGLRLSPQDVERTLQQLTRSPSAPQLDSSAMSRQADSTGRSSGAASRVGLHGPRPRSDMFAARRGPRSNQPLRGGTQSQADEPLGAAEVIDVSSRAAALDAAGNVRGVPVGYRDQAEAYFRRLAEEATREQTRPAGRE